MSTPTPVAEPGATPVSPMGERHGELRYSPFLPLLLLVVSAVAWPAFQCYQLFNEKQALATVFGNQTRQFDESGKLRNSLEGLARETAQLAAKGNPSARLIVDQLARRGVTINPSAQPSTPPKAAK
jgi:hypothetical protein